MAGTPALRDVAVEGQAVRLPVVVRDATSMFATFLVPSAPARRLFPQSTIELAEVFPGRALLSLAAIEYRDNDLGRYLEMAVAFPVRLANGRRPWPLVGMALDFRAGRGGVYIHRLPVTTAFSCEAGRGIWGFPKTVSDLRFEDAGERRSASWTEGGRLVFALAAARGGRRSFRDAPLDAYAIRDGVVRRTRFTSSGDEVGMHLGATVTLGDHPWAEELRALGLPKRPLMSGWTGRFTARFEAPQIVA